jgi:hypothetical protein
MKLDKQTTGGVSASLGALRLEHERRRQRTLIKLNAALLRMANGETIILQKGFKWTKSSLSAEAEVHPNTLSAKSQSGALVYQSVIDRLTNFRSRRLNASTDLKQKQIDAQKTEIHELIIQRDNLLKQLEAKDSQIIAAKEAKLEAIEDKEAMADKLRKEGLLS